LLWLFWRWGLSNHLPVLALNHKLPDTSLLNSKDYKWDPPALDLFLSFN
jgi:hypothetical protein